MSTLIECTKYCGAVYRDEEEGTVYERSVIAWGTYGEDYQLVAMVYDDAAGLEPADTDTNFVALNFDPDLEPEDFIDSLMLENTDIADAGVIETSN